MRSVPLPFGFNFNLKKTVLRRSKPSFADSEEKHFEFCSGRQSTLLNHSSAKPCQQQKQQQHDIFQKFSGKWSYSI